MGLRVDPLRVVVHGISHPGQGVATGLDHDPAHVAQQLLLVMGPDQSVVTLRDGLQDPIRTLQREPDSLSLERVLEDVLDHQQSDQILTGELLTPGIAGFDPGKPDRPPRRPERDEHQRDHTSLPESETVAHGLGGHRSLRPHFGDRAPVEERADPLELLQTERGQPGVVGTGTAVDDEAARLIPGVEEGAGVVEGGELVDRRSDRLIDGVGVRCVEPRGDAGGQVVDGDHSLQTVLRRQTVRHLAQHQQQEGPPVDVESPHRGIDRYHQAGRGAETGLELGPGFRAAGDEAGPMRLVVGLEIGTDQLGETTTPEMGRRISEQCRSTPARPEDDAVHVGDDHRVRDRVEQPTDIGRCETSDFANDCHHY